MNSPEGFRGYQGLDRSGIIPEPKDTNSNSSVARREVGSVEKTGLSDKIKNFARRVGTLGLATIILSGPMASEVQAEESPTDGVQPEVTDTVIVSPEPTAEVKAAVTASVEDPEAKVSVEDLKAVFESYKQNLFAPYKEELKRLGCENEARIDFCSKILYAYDNGKDMADGDTKDKFQNYITRDQVTNYAKTGEGLEVLTNENGDPRMLMVNSTKEITQGVVDSIDWFTENGCTNISQVLYDNGAVVYFCSGGYGGKAGSFLITEYGVVCSEMTKDNIVDANLCNMNIKSLYVESLGILQSQMRSALGISRFGDFLGDVEMAKTISVSYIYLELFNTTGNSVFQVYGDRSGTIDYLFSIYNISATDPRIEKQVALASAVSEPLTGLNWDNVPEIQKMREMYLSSN